MAGPAIDNVFFFPILSIKVFYLKQLIDIWTYHVKVCWSVFLLVRYNILVKSWREKKIVKIRFLLF